MASIPVNVSASLPVKVSGHRKLTGCMASASVPLKAPASVSLKSSASLPVKASAASVSAQKKLPGDTKLKGFKSDYVFIRYAGPDELKSYDRLDFAFFGRTWIANISWSLVFAPSVREDNWKDLLSYSKGKLMNTGELPHVIASGSSNGVLFAVDKGGYHEAAAHGVRTVVPLKDLKTDAHVQSGGSLLLHIGLMSIIKDTGEVSADNEYTFDGHVYWDLYLN